MSTVGAETTGGVSRLRLPSEDEWPDEFREVVESRIEKLGFLPNVMRAFALQPGHFLSWFRYFRELLSDESSSLTEAQREMIAVIVSAENRCHY